MRVIKFRAKCLDNGEWVCGGSSLISDDFCVIQKGTEFYCETRVYSRTERFFQLQGFVCDKKTLGQFTGLLDKNGKEIFEGDIMRIPETEFNIEIIGVVEFDRGSYVVRSFFSGTHSSLAWAIRERQSGERRGVVIGNIHDNPELLKGGAK